MCDVVIKLRGLTKRYRDFTALENMDMTVYKGDIYGLMPEDEKERELRIVLARLKRLDELIDSFFEFSRTISCDMPPEFEQVNLVEILQESIAHYYDDFSGQNRHIEFVCDASKYYFSQITTCC